MKEAIKHLEMALAALKGEMGDNEMPPSELKEEKEDLMEEVPEASEEKDEKKKMILMAMKKLM